ncbi:MAG: hypothetical protein ACKKL5_03945 [Candidatus Komeilibacteria bacterium]
MEFIKKYGWVFCLLALGQTMYFLASWDWPALGWADPNDWWYITWHSAVGVEQVYIWLVPQWTIVFLMPLSGAVLFLFSFHAVDFLANSGVRDWQDRLFSIILFVVLIGLTVAIHYSHYGWQGLSWFYWVILVTVIWGISKTVIAIELENIDVNVWHLVAEIIIAGGRYTGYALSALVLAIMTMTLASVNWLLAIFVAGALAIMVHFLVSFLSLLVMFIAAVVFGVFSAYLHPANWFMWRHLRT